MSDQFCGNVNQNAGGNAMVFMKDSSDHRTGKTGLTLTITASKDGAAFASITPTVTERGSGWYNLAFTSAHRDTLGPLAVHITGTGADPEDLVWLVTDPGADAWSGATRELTDKDGFNLHADYDAAKSAASQSSVDALGSPMQAGDKVALDATQPDYAPAKSGDEMTLTAAYDAAKTAATQASVDTVDGNVDDIETAVAALPTAADIVAAVLDHLLSGHATAGTVGKALADAAAPGGDTALLKLIANACSKIIGCQAWDGSQTSPLALAFSGSVSDGLMTLYAAPVGDVASKFTLGTWDGSTFTKDAGWTGQVAKGLVLYFETDSDWANTAGVVTMTVKSAFLGSSLSIAWNLPAVSGASKGWPTVDGGIQYEEGGTWKMLPEAVAGDGTIWDALLSDHQLADSFGAWLTTLAREGTLLAQLVTGVVQNRVLVNAGGAVETYTENVRTHTFNLGSDHALTGRRLFLTVKADPTGDNGTAIIAGECTVTDAANGVATYTTDKVETATAGDYYYDLVSTDSDGTSNPTTEAAGDWKILQGVRRN